MDKIYDLEFVKIGDLTVNILELKDVKISTRDEWFNENSKDKK
jgi:hypothetical protein